MGTIQVSASLDAERVAEARARVGERQLSRYLDEALALRLQHDRLGELEDELADDFGPIPDAARQRVDSVEWPR